MIPSIPQRALASARFLDFLSKNKQIHLGNRTKSLYLAKLLKFCIDKPLSLCYNVAHTRSPAEDFTLSEKRILP